MGQLNVLEKRIGEFTEAIENALLYENWHAALITAVTLPDICCRLDGSKVGFKSKEPYTKWFDKYVLDYKWEIVFREQPIVYNNGSNAYAFRCAFLHDGDGDLLSHSARDPGLGIDSIEFLIDDTSYENEAGIRAVFSAAIDDRKLILNVKEYCENIVFGVNTWLKDYKHDEKVGERARNMIEIKLKSTYTAED